MAGRFRGDAVSPTTTAATSDPPTGELAYSHAAAAQTGGVALTFALLLGIMDVATPAADPRLARIIWAAALAAGLLPTALIRCAHPSLADSRSSDVLLTFRPAVSSHVLLFPRPRRPF